ncbi:hypothetical protein C5167_009198 [Papaver somniferum]|uniref:Uncharacterized protein n=1 Tax=Papaver somniferum TaxID=3469 RepID=A0A4Y7K0M1_PAPSO|nr:hypothetical protein C5167_009198 [Papaver somniferum]
MRKQWTAAAKDGTGGMEIKVEMVKAEDQDASIMTENKSSWCSAVEVTGAHSGVTCVKNGDVAILMTCTGTHHYPVRTKLLRKIAELKCNSASSMIQRA